MKKHLLGRAAIVFLVASIILIHFTPLCYADGCKPLQLSAVPDQQLVPKESSICGISLGIVGQNTEVMGINLGFMNYAQSLKGFDIALLLNSISATEKKYSWGIQLAAVNYMHNASFFGGQAGLFNTTSVRVNENGIIGDIYGKLGLTYYSPGAEFNGIQIGLLSSGYWRVNGIQLSFIGNGAENINGLQIALYANGAKHLNGLQAALIGNAAGVDESDVSNGIQIGFYNRSNGDFNGIQVGIINSSRRYVNGIEVGLINWCESLRGLQIGFVNVVSGRFPDKGLFVFPFINAGF